MADPITSGDTWKTVREKFNELLSRTDSQAPKPQLLSGEGLWTLLSASAGQSLLLPSGGTWAWFYIGYTTSGAIFQGGAYVSAGGTQIGAAQAGTIRIGFAWRIA